jgi:hypothetical protein
LHNTLRDLIGMSLLFVCVLQELGGDAFRVDAGGHEIMTAVSKRTNDLGCKRFVQKFDYGFAVCAIALGDSTILDVLSGAFAQGLDVSEKWLISHGLTPLNLDLGEFGS